MGPRAWGRQVRKRLGELRDDYESRAAFVRHLGVHDRRVSDWLNTRLPTADNLFLIGRQTGCSVDWLLGLSEQRYRSSAASEPELSHELAAYLRGAVARAVGADPEDLTVSGKRALRIMVEREIAAFKQREKTLTPAAKARVLIADAEAGELSTAGFRELHDLFDQVTNALPGHAPYAVEWTWLTDAKGPVG